MSSPSPQRAPGGPAGTSVSAQILATEHWSLLATRNLAWTESFSRASWFVTVVSAATVALALVASTTDFGHEFRIFALLVIAVLVIIGVATVIRLAQLNAEEVALIIGMNRLRRGYLDLAPELEQYFATGHTEDLAGIMQTYGTRRSRIPKLQYASSIAQLVGTIVAVLVGALAGIAGRSLGLELAAAVVVGAVVAITALVSTTVLLVRHVNATWPRIERDDHATPPGPTP